MKSIIFLIVTAIIASSIFFAINAKAGDPIEHPEKYCAKLKDGVKVIMHEGKEMTTETSLNNGTRIQPDGTIIKKDGTKTMLNEGECVNKDGVVAPEKETGNKMK